MQHRPNRLRNQRLVAPVALLALATGVAGAMPEEYQEARSVFRQADASAPYFQDAYGYALFPTIGKGAVGIGGAHGDGRVYVDGDYVGNTQVSQVSFGFQFGGQTYTQVVFFEDQEDFEDFTSGDFEFGAQVAATAVTASAQATASTTGSTAGASASKEQAELTGGYTNGFAVFTVAKAGAMYEASVQGQKFSYTPVD